MKISQVYFFFSKNQNEGAITGRHSWFLPLSSPFALMVQWLRPEGCSLSSVPLLFHCELPPERHTHPWILQGKFDIRSEPGSLVYHQSKRGTYSAFPMKTAKCYFIKYVPEQCIFIVVFKNQERNQKNSMKQVSPNSCMVSGRLRTKWLVFCKASIKKMEKNFSFQKKTADIDMKCQVR